LKLTVNAENLPMDDVPASPLEITILEQDNIRGAMGWPVGREFRACVARWAASRPDGVRVVIEIDERRRHTSTQSSSQNPRASCFSGGRVVAVYSGSRMRADDSIVRDTEWWLARSDVARVLVVSSDKLVRRRCREARDRVGGGKLVTFESGDAFASQLCDVPEIAHEAAPAAALEAEVASPGEDATAVFAAWIDQEQPTPHLTAFELVHAAERGRRGSKRKLGVYR
jgi:hypothetical protein